MHALETNYFLKCLISQVVFHSLVPFVLFTLSKPFRHLKLLWCQNEEVDTQGNPLTDPSESWTRIDSALPSFPASVYLFLVELDTHNTSGVYFPLQNSGTKSVIKYFFCCSHSTVNGMKAKYFK